jgi:outer membrane protein OmpA-like peptidoglycan-associated protein
MNQRRPFAVLIALAAGLVYGCGPQRLRTNPQTGQAMIVLLPNPGDGAVGRASVTNAAGAADLTAAREFTSVLLNQRPAAVAVISEADVQRIFGAALAGLPPAPQQFNLFFRFESEELTVESRALVPQILQAVNGRPFPEVGVTGHTDTTGPAAINIQLGLRRATAIRALLIAAGIDASLIEVSSHGEADLLIKTGDEVAEPRNRRVDIVVR